MIDKKIESDTEYLVKEVPLLYNYMSDSGALKFSENHQIMVSKPTRFNDPYDCLPELIKFESFPKEYKDHPNFNKQGLEKFLREKSFPNIVDKTGVSCFSETGTIILM